MRSELEGWPKVVEIKEASQRFRERGWTIPADQLATTVNFFGPPSGSGGSEMRELDLAIESIWQDHAAISTIIKRIDGYWDNIQSHDKKLRASNDKVLVTYLSASISPPLFAPI